MLNILDFIFLNLAFTVTIVGYLITNYERHLPVFIVKAYKYGSFAYQGSGANYLQVIEVPKSYYRHFYIFSSVFSLISLSYMFIVYFLSLSVNSYVPVVLKVFLEQDQPSVSVSASLIVMFLLTLQSVRRLYETIYLQVFGKASKMNLSHYAAGLIHYFACIVAVIGEAPLFCGNENLDNILWNDTRTKGLAVPSVLIFLWSWYEQYKSNVILVNLRRDKKSGEVVSEDHQIPYGRLFESVSSPHRLCEIIIYTILVILLPTKTFFCIYLWVLSNQIQTAIQAHEWYKTTFKNYPKNRKAVIPHVL